MKRKIMKIADTTYVVSLPLQWARKHNVKKGDEIEVEESGKKLSLILESKAEVKTTTIDLVNNKTTNYVKGIIINAYRKGYDEIIVNYTDESQKIEIVSSLDEILGLEIIEEKEKKLVLRNLTKVDSTQFDNLMRRAFLVLLSSAETSVEEINTSTFHIEKYYDMNKTIRKLTNICKRILSQSQIYSDDMIYYYMIVREIEKISNEYKYFLKYIQINNLKIEKSTLDFLREINQLMRSFYDLFYKKDVSIINSLSKDKNRLLWISTYEKLENSKDKVVIHHLGSIIRRIFDMHGPILAISQTWNQHN